MTRNQTSAIARPASRSDSAAVYRVNDGSDDLLEKAFQLAYFIVQDRSAAIETVSGAAKKLTAEQSREKRRAYWRIKRLKQRIRKMTRNQQDMFQWLIYFESEKYEKQQEQQGRLDRRAMAIRYIKYLAQMTSSMSCFYVAVGLHRILHNYTTSEIQEAYEFLTQQYGGAEKYRRVKRKLMHNIVRRFCKCITISKWDKQELRFDVYESQGEWVALATQCLEMFTPWSTRHCCSQSVHQLTPDNRPSKIRGNRIAPLWQDIEEMKKCHIFIHPGCFDQLTRTLGLDPRPTRLAMPRFVMDDEEDSTDKFEWEIRNPPSLSAAERQLLKAATSGAEKHPRRHPPRSVTILADGVLCARLDLSQETHTQWRAAEGVRLIEFCTGAEQTGEAEVIALHWVDYTALDGIAAGEFVIPIGIDGELILKIVPAGRHSDDAGDATMSLAVRQPCPAIGRKGWFNHLHLVSVLGKYAFAGMLMILGLFGLWLHDRAGKHEVATTPFLAEQQETNRISGDRMQAQIASATEVPLQRTDKTKVYRLFPDSLFTRGAGNIDNVTVLFSSEMPVIRLELPVYDADNKKLYHATLKRFSASKPLLELNRLKPEHLGDGLALMFTVPGAAVKNGERYVVMLESVNAGALKRVANFSFYVQKR